MNDKVLKLRQTIEGSDNIVFFGGAGVSTESNIPDFRGEDASTNVKKRYGRIPEELLHIDTLQNAPEVFFSYYRDTLLHPDARPNAAHIALKKLEYMEKLTGIITQNIDGLHQAAGCHKVIELHGSVYQNYCVRCACRYPITYVMRSKETIPRCEHCGGIVRPDIVLYGENLKPQVLKTAQEWLENCDVLIVAGTSLVVYPAAALIQYYTGNQLVLINQSDTSYDRRANLLIRSSVGKTMRDAVSKFWS